MKYSELLGKSADELKAMLIDLKKNAFNMRFQKASGELEDTSKVRGIRKDVARIQTALSALTNEADAPKAAPAKKTKKKAA